MAGYRNAEEDDLREECEALRAEVERLQRRMRGMSGALREIAEQDDIEMALDPTWAKRIARALLEEKTHAR